MANHDHSERARACVREYVEQNAQLIRSWLEGSGTLDDVGAELILSEVEKYKLSSKPDLRGLAGPSIDKIFREAPGGKIAVRRGCIHRHSPHPCDLGYVLLPVDWAET